MTKIIIPLSIAFAAGFFANHILGPTSISQEPPIVDAKCEDLSHAKSDLISLSQREYLEYAQIKDLKQKYEKADELLGKVMLLFLADVGFKAVKTAPPEYSASAELPPSQAPTPRTIENLANENPVPLPVPQGAETLAGRSDLIRTLSNERRIQDVLSNSIIDDPKVKAAQGGTPSRRQIRLLEVW